MPPTCRSASRPRELRILHYGYLKARIEASDKHARNLELLERELRARPDARSRTSTSAPSTSASASTAARRAHFEQALQAARGEHAAGSELGYVPLLVARASSASAARRRIDGRRRARRASC